MARLKMAFKHEFPEGQALSRVQDLLGEVREEFSVEINDWQESWNGNVGTVSFRFIVFSVSGTLAVTDRELSLNGKASLIIRATIGSTLEERARLWGFTLL